MDKEKRLREIRELLSQGKEHERKMKEIIKKIVELGPLPGLRIDFQTWTAYEIDTTGGP